MSGWQIPTAPTGSANIWPCPERDAAGSPCGLGWGHAGPHQTQSQLTEQLAAVPAGATMTRRYAGSYERAMAAFEADARSLAASDWYPVSQQYLPGQWGCGAWVVAVLLLIFLVGIIVLAYMIAVRPAGELIATFEHRPAAVAPAGPGVGTTKVCPDCAETVQAEARICRFCRHEFETG